MTVILGIDAAWTEIEPSGVGLIDKQEGAWRCLAVAPSYSAFLDLARDRTVNWNCRHYGGRPPISELLTAASAISRKPVDVVVLDMPVSTKSITARRYADDCVSRESGSRWCSAHTPSKLRPGALGSRLTEELARLGYPVATVETSVATMSRLVEVYPHPALLSLLGRQMRVPYKVSKSRKYWPGKSPKDRVALLLREFRTIDRALREFLGSFEIPLPSDSDAPVTLAGLKRFEDALDALVCCWIGAQYVEGRTTALGDASAAIWCPSNVLQKTLDTAGRTV